MKVKIVKNQKEGLELAKNLLYKVINNKTVLFLSGGKTPKDLYLTLAKEKRLKVGAIAMIDERCGEKMHNNSNEKMIGETGFWSYLEKKKIPFYPILRLHPRGAASNFAKDYDRKVKYLLRYFSKSIALMGIGEDGHTASLPAGTPHFAKASRGKQNSKFKIQNYVEGVNDFPGEFKERITLTFTALAQMDLLIILAFGRDKKKALKMMFEEGSIEQIPARFYKRPEITDKTLLITDQKI